jgi:hypothetical protein
VHTRKRTVHFYELVLQSKTRAEGIPSPSSARLDDLLDAFGKLGAAKYLEIERPPNMSVTLTDWNYDAATKCYEVLINKADANLSDVTLRNLSTKATRKAGKTKIEGIETSSHILIKPQADGKTALVLMTMGAGVSIDTVVRLLRKLERLTKKNSTHAGLFNFPHPSGAKNAKKEPVTYKVQYQFVGVAYRGRTLTEALKTGHFEAMDLITHVQTGFDDGGNLQIQEKSITVTAQIPEAVKGSTIINAIKKFPGMSKGETFDRARIRYKSAAGKSITTTLNVNELDAAFTHSELIEFTTDVDAQQVKLSSTILQEMKLLLPTVV